MAEERHEMQPAPEGQRDLGDQLKLAGIVIAGFVLVAFFFSNLQDVTINFLWLEWKTDMIWALLVSAVLGGVSVFFAMWFRRRQRERTPQR